MKPSGIISCEPGRHADHRFHDGALRHVAGVKNYQVIRATPSQTSNCDGYGWTYNHAPMLCWWKGRYFLEYLSNPKSEHVAPGQSLLCVSEDGVRWQPARVVFPIYNIPSAPYKGPQKELLPPLAPTVTHNRMGFYVTKGGRLLVSSFYGFSPDGHLAPNNGWGVGRVVREIYEDLSFSPVYFIRYNRTGGFDETNTPGIAGYRTSPDKGFVDACDELLSNRLVTQQWWEEDRNEDYGFFTVKGAEALSYYTAADGAVIGVFKSSWVSESRDGGENWTELCQEPTLATNTAKVWGQHTKDGRYALVYNPTTDAAHRWPLAVATGDDGRQFSGLLAAVPEISPGRYRGLLKNLGAQYVRGICESNPQPPEDAMWLCYSVNKEDIWVARLPLPITGTVDEDVDDHFGDTSVLDKWNLYVPAWCPVGIEDVAGEGRCLTLRNTDPYDRARAQRAFPPSVKAEIRTRFLAQPTGANSGFLIELQDERGMVAQKLVFDSDGGFAVKNSGAYHNTGRYRQGEWLDLVMTTDCNEHRTHILLKQGEQVLLDQTVLFCADTTTLERILFATKPSLPFNGLEDIGRHGAVGGLPGADDPVEESVYRIASLTIITR